MYAGVDIQGEVDMTLPDGEDFDDDLGEFLYISFVGVFRNI